MFELITAFITVILTCGIHSGVKVTEAVPLGVIVINAVLGDVAVLDQVKLPLPVTAPEEVVTPFHNTDIVAVPVTLY